MAKRTPTFIPFTKIDPTQRPPQISTEIPFIKIDPTQGPDHKRKTLSGNLYPIAAQFLRWDEALVTVEDLGTGETMTWFHAEPEVHYILRGKAEMTYSLGATYHTAQKSVTIEEGDCYIVPAAAHITWKVSPEGPLRKFRVKMPWPRRAGELWGPEAVEKLR